MKKEFNVFMAKDNRKEEFKETGYGSWFCSISGNVKNVGSMCEHNPNSKHKCRSCANIRFSKNEKNI